MGKVKPYKHDEKKISDACVIDTVNVRKRLEKIINKRINSDDIEKESQQIEILENMFGKRELAFLLFEELADRDNKKTVRDKISDYFMGYGGNPF